MAGYIDYEIDTLSELVLAVQDARTGGYDVVLDVQPRRAGEYGIVVDLRCDEYVGMAGRWQFGSDGVVLERP